MSRYELREFFQWMSLINIGLLVFSSVLIMALKKTVGEMHGKMFGIDPDKVAVVSYGYLGVFKVLVLVFNIVPYISLLIMNQ